MEDYVGKICPFCKTAIDEEDMVKVCPACGIPHHESCWEENKGCMTAGCSEQVCEPQDKNPTDDHKEGSSTNDASKQFCTKCGTELLAGESGCSKCEAEAHAKEVKTAKKKKLIITIAAAVVALAVILTLALYVLPEYIIPQINLSKAVKAFESQDYELAMEYYEKTDGLQNRSENSDRYLYSVAAVQFEANEFKKAATNYSKTNGLLDSNEKIFDCGMTLQADEDYEGAIACFTLISSPKSNAYKVYCEGMIAYQKENYDEAIEKLVLVEYLVESVTSFLPQVYFEYGISIFEKGEYLSAAIQFTKAEDYPEAKTYVTACSLMIAEDLYEEGRLTAAKTAYDKLPQDFTFEDISVADRMNTLNNAESFFSICGKWSATKNYIETRNVYRWNGSWDGWKIDDLIEDQTIEIFCRLNSDGTATILGSVTFYRYTDYSTIRQYNVATEVTKTFAIDNVKEFPSSYDIDEFTTLSYSNGKFSLKYCCYDEYSSYFYNRYQSTVTYGKKTIVF